MLFVQDPKEKFGLENWRNRMKNKTDRIAPDGQIWVCSACGKTSKDKYRNWDTSCAMHAVLCYENTNPGRGPGSWVAVEENE